MNQTIFFVNKFSLFFKYFVVRNIQAVPKKRKRYKIVKIAHFIVDVLAVLLTRGGGGCWPIAIVMALFGNWNKS